MTRRRGTPVCSGVSSSISTPSEASFSRAISSSISRGMSSTRGRQLARAAHQVLDRQREVGEAQVHRRRRVALPGRQVHHAPAREEVQAPVLGQRELLDQREHLLHPPAGELAQALDVDLHVEVPRVGQHGAVLHALEVLAPEHAARAGDRHEQVAALGRLERGHHLEAVHARLERPQRVDLAHDQRRARAARPLGDALARGSVAEQHEGAPGQQQVGGAQDAVERRLAGAVAVVEGALGARLVHGHHRAGQPPLGLEPADAQQAGGGLLGAADQVVESVAAALVHEQQQVGAVVERDLRPEVGHRRHVLGVDRGVVAPPRAAPARPRRPAQPPPRPAW